jgi:putative membrane protein
VQIVTAVVAKSDAYVELPWKAFALGASLAGLALVILDALRPQWTTSETALIHATVILSTGAAAGALTILAPPFARLFLRRSRRDLEVRLHAESLFFKHNLSNTRGRNAVLILISGFERRVHILADRGLDGRVANAEWQQVVDRMTPHLRKERPFDALREALTRVAALLEEKRVVAEGRVANELPNAPIEEREP